MSVAQCWSIRRCLETFSGFVTCSVICKISLCFFLLLDSLCRFLCIRCDNHLPSPEGLVLWRRENLLFSLAQALGCPSTLCDCLSSLLWFRSLRFFCGWGRTRRESFDGLGHAARVQGVQGHYYSVSHLQKMTKRSGEIGRCGHVFEKSSLCG